MKTPPQPTEPRRAALGIDPDGTHTALCVLWSDGTASLVGGGTRADGRPLCTVTGARDVLLELGVTLVAGVFVETQAPRSAWSADVEGCRRSRYMWEAACELLSVPVTAVDPKVWQSAWVGPKTPQNRSSCVSRKRANGGAHPLRTASYAQSDVRGPLVGVKCANDDQRAALGIAAHGAGLLGWTMPWS